MLEGDLEKAEDRCESVIMEKNNAEASLEEIRRERNTLSQQVESLEGITMELVAPIF